MSTNTRRQEFYDEDHAASESEAHWYGVWMQKLEDAKHTRDMWQREMADCDRRLKTFTDPDMREGWERYRQHCQELVESPSAEWRRDYDEARRVLRETFGVKAE